MENALTYVMPGALVEGRALLGQYRLATAIQITEVRVQARAMAGSGLDGLTRIGLEVNGVPTLLTVELVRGPAVGSYVTKSVRTSLTVPAGAEMRWRCVASPEESEDGLENWNLSVIYAEPGSEVRPVAVMTVRYRNGEEDALVYNYDAASGLFIEAVPGIASGRVTVTGGANFTVEFPALGGGSNLALQARNEDLLCGQLIDNGMTATNENARIELWITLPSGTQRVGTVTELGKLRVAQAQEIGTMLDMPLGQDRFVMRSGGQARAVLGVKGVGLVAVKVSEFGAGLRGTEEGDERGTEEGDERGTD